MANLFSPALHVGALRGKMQSSAELKSALEALHAHGDDAVRTKAKGLSEQLFSSL